MTESNNEPTWNREWEKRHGIDVFYNNFYSMYVAVYRTCYWRTRFPGHRNTLARNLARTKRVRRV